MAACFGDLPAGRGSQECVDKLAPFNQQCFHSVATNAFFSYAPGITLPSQNETDAFYAASFPPAPPSPPPPSNAARVSHLLAPLLTFGRLQTCWAVGQC